jgi:uncharacterized phage-associated protein
MSVEFPFDFERTQAAIMYLASKELPELTKYKICKLLFLADKYHLVRFGRVITGDKYWAIPHGPVPTRTLNLLDDLIANVAIDPESASLSKALELDRKYEHPRFKAATAFDAAKLSQSDIMALDMVVAEYGRMWFGELKAITHSMFAYKKAWNERPNGSNRAAMDFVTFFEEDSDAVVGARDTMLEDDFLRKSSPAR